MEKDKTQELLEDLYELFYYGFPVYPNTPVREGDETFMERVEELLRLQKEKQ